MPNIGTRFYDDTTESYIRQIRTFAGKTQEECGKLIGVSQARFSYWENSLNAKFSDEQIEILQKAFNVPLYLLQKRHSVCPVCGEVDIPKFSYADQWICEKCYKTAKKLDY